MSTANSPIPKNIPKVPKMSMKTLVGKKQNKTVQFMDTDLVISKLNVGDIHDIQTQARELEAAEKEGAKDDMSGMAVMRTVIRKGAEGGQDLTDEDFNTFPMDELSALSNAIMEFSGIANKAAGEVEAGN